MFSLLMAVTGVAPVFAYISGSAYVLEDLHGISSQLFSVVFAVNSAGLIVMTQVGAHQVARLGSGRLLRRGLIGTACASVATLVVIVAHAGLGWLLLCFFAPRQVRPAVAVH